MSSSWNSLSSLGRGAVQGLLQLVYPNTCWACGAYMTVEQELVCSACLPLLTRDPFPTCPRCSSSVGPNLILDKGCPECRDRNFTFDGVFRMAPYDGLLREVILRMKQWTGEELVEVIGTLWARQMAPRLQHLTPEVVIPVPLHWTRQWWRGFNQSAVLAACLAQHLNVPSNARLLRRVRRTRQQKQQQSATARRENVKQAFQAAQNADLAGKTILLVDDVLTSGETANESARALRSHKPKAIYVAVLAHGK
jgi:ComF family protein